MMLQFVFPSKLQHKPTYNITVRQIDCPKEVQMDDDLNNLLLQVHTQSLFPLPVTDAAGENNLILVGLRDSNQQGDISNRQTDDVSEVLNCNQIISSSEFVLQSPNYPANYPNNVQCVAIVYPSSNNICALGKFYLFTF